MMIPVSSSFSTWRNCCKTSRSFFFFVLLVDSCLFLYKPTQAQTVVFEQAHRLLEPGAQAESFPFLSNQEATHPDTFDVSRSKIWDDFTLTSATELTGIAWTGAFDGPINPDSPGELDFLVQVWADANEQPALARPLASWTLDGGKAGLDEGNQVRSEQVPGQFVVRGGIVSEYTADPLPSFPTLDAGDYWLSVVAIQTFPSDDFFDPGWGWSQGLSGDNNGFRFDNFVTPPEPGDRVDRDFAFRLWTGTKPVRQVTVDLNADGLVNQTDIDRLSEYIRSPVTGLIAPDGSISIAAESEQLLAAEFTSQSGSLVPSTTGARPFSFFLANTPTQVTFGNLGVGESGKDQGTGPLLLEGRVELPIGFAGEFDPWTDLSAQWGIGRSNFSFPISRIDLDLNEDGKLDDQDRQEWLSATGTLLGDADLDGTVGFADFLVTSSSFGAAATWATGDFDGDGLSGFGDFLALSASFGMSAAAVASVPEPGGFWPPLLAAVSILFRRSRRHIARGAMC